MAKLRTLIAIAAVVLAGLSLARGASPPKTPLKGTVKSSDGRPMEGVAVSVRVEGKNIRTSVYTDRDGAYYFPQLEDGQYKVLAQAVGFEPGRSALRLSADKAAEQNFTLQPLKDFSRQLSGVEWMASLPESTPQDRRAKRILGVNCNQCHPMGFVLQNRFDATGWASIVKLMSTISWNGEDPMRIAPDAYINGYKDELVAYLSRVLGPNSEAVLKPLPRVTGEATQIVVTEYDISPGHLPGYLVVENGSDWSLGTPSHHESRAVHDNIVDLEGNVWFTDNVTPNRSFGKLDPRTGRVTDYTEISEKGTPVAVHDINVDPRGNIWFNNATDGSLDRFDPKTEKFQHFPVPAGSPRGVGGLVGIDSKGNVWGRVGAKRVLEVNQKWGLKHYRPDPEQPGGAAKLDPQTGKYTYYQAVRPSGNYYSIGIDAEDNAYFTQVGVDRIGVVDGRTGKVSEIDISSPDHGNVLHTDLDKELVTTFDPTDATGPPWQKGPRRQVQSMWTALKYAANKNQFNAHWFTLSKASAIAKVDIHTKKVTEYSLPHPYSFPYQLTVDRNNMVWVTAMNTDRLFKFNPSTERWTEYALPTLGTDSRCVDVDNTTNPPTVWLSYWGTSQVARIQFRTAESTRAGR